MRRVSRLTAKCSFQDRRQVITRQQQKHFEESSDCIFRSQALAPPKTGPPPTPKKSDEAKVRRVSQIGRLLVGELSEVGPDGAVVDLGQAWKGFIPAPMFAWSPPEGGSDEPSTSGREEGGKGESAERKGLTGGSSGEAARAREELERTLYGVKLKVRVEAVSGKKASCKVVDLLLELRSWTATEQNSSFEVS